MAEGVFRHMMRYGQSDANLRIKNVDSCGTIGYHAGSAPDRRTLQVLRKYSITKDEYSHKARQIKDSDFSNFDFIFAMDLNNQQDLESRRDQLISQGKLSTEESGTIALWGIYGKDGCEEVMDPYYGEIDGFEVAYEQMARFTNAFEKQMLI